MTPPPWRARPGGSHPGLPGDLRARFVAKVIDGLLLALVLTVTSAVLGFAALDMGMRSGVGVDLLSTLVSAGIVVGGPAYLEATQGRTPGKAVMGLRVENLVGDHPTMRQAVVRNAYLAVVLIGILPLIGAAVAALAFLVVAGRVAATISDDPLWRRGWHDRLAGTRVVTSG